MLHEFIVEQRLVIIERTQLRVKNRTWPSVSADELEFGVPLFLTQLSETLRLEATAEPFPEREIQTDGGRHGAELMSRGYSIAQVVQDYGDICQVITELAVETNFAITAEAQSPPRSFRRSITAWTSALPARSPSMRGSHGRSTRPRRSNGSATPRTRRATS